MKVLNKRDGDVYTLKFGFNKRTAEMSYTDSGPLSSDFDELFAELIYTIYNDEAEIKFIVPHEMRNIIKEYFEGNYTI